MANRSTAHKKSKKRPRLLFDGAEWDFRSIQDTYAAIEEIALDDLGLDVYQNQIEIISSEQMLDAYCSIGMPLMYQHWSFGKRFVQEEAMYRSGNMGLAYEIVINSSPCISYYMEESTMPIQTLVLAHAAFGHNHFFKNNYLFQQWTDADGILDYLEFSKRFIASCEERHGLAAVEEIIDAAHALMDQGIFRYRRQPKPNLRQQEERERERRAYHEKHYNDLWRTLPDYGTTDDTQDAEHELAERKKQLKRLDYLEFSKRFIASCEERHGLAAVEEIIDAAHALMDQGIFRYRRQPKPNLRQQEERERERRAYHEKHYNDLWRTLPDYGTTDDTQDAEHELAERKKQLKLPEENLLYFIEKNSPTLEAWECEILRIVRNISQYFYPQKQTKMMNEGCATFVHHYIVNELYDRGLITEGALMEILHSHSNVVFQPGYDDPRFSGINPYALGLAMMQDIRRIATEPTDEDRLWFPDFAGSGDWRAVLRDAWANFRDESFIRQFLSPHLIRELKLFQLSDVEKESHLTVTAIHDEAGYESLRNAFAQSYDITALEPDIQIVDVNLLGDRELVLQHTVRDGVPLTERGRDAVLACLRRLWGYDVQLIGIDHSSGDTLYEARTGESKKDGDTK